MYFHYLQQPFQMPWQGPWQQTCRGMTYMVQPGDTLFLIARRFNVSLNALIAANPQISDPNLIFPGQIICIPIGRCPRGFVYIVQPGDTLFLIARRYNISLQSLIAANPQIPDPNLIFPGQAICIPLASCPGGFMYTVQPGDSLFSIAQRFNVPLQAIIRANPQIVDPNLIFPGQIICIPRAQSPMPWGWGNWGNWDNNNEDWDNWENWQ